MRGLPLLFTTVLMLAAGCTAPAEEGDPLPTEGTHVIDPATGRLQPLVPVEPRFAAPAQAVVQDFTDAFAAGEHWTNHGELTAQAGVDAGGMHVRDITAMVPKDVPVRVVAELSAQMEHGDLDLFFNFANDAVWTSDFDTPFGGNSRLEFLVVRTTDDPVSVFVFYDEAEPAQSVPYTLRVEAHVDPTVLPPGVPVLVEAPAGATRMELDFNGTGVVMAWGPDDGFLGRLAADGDAVMNLTLDGGGEYVLLVPEGLAPASVRLWVPERPGLVAPELRAAKQDIQSTAPVQFAANQPASMTFDAAKVPIQVGLEIRIPEFTQGAAGALDSPAGNLITYAFADTLPFMDPNPLSDMGFLMLTEIGVEGLVPGTYSGTFAGDPNGSGALIGWIVHYAR